MAKTPMAKATLGAERSLTQRELETVRAALRLWMATDVADIPDEVYEEIGDAAGALSDVDVRALLYELLTCRKVTICRSNA